MIDPTNVTNFNQTEAQLQENILWWVTASGKNGITSAKCLDKLLTKWGFPEKEPFQIIRKIVCILPQEMKNAGIGCYNIKAKTFLELAYSNLHLQTCSLDDLLKIKGIGNKTARCFFIHSRPNQKLAGLDTHIKKYLKDVGYLVPKTLNNKKYKELEEVFLEIVDNSGMSCSELDLLIWNVYSGRNTTILKEQLWSYA